MHKLPGALAAAALLVLPALLTLYVQHPDPWAKSVIPLFQNETIPRHTPRFTEGLLLPDTLTQSQRITRESGPVLIRGAVRVPPGIRLTLEPGVSVYASEFSTLKIEGELVARGSAELPILFSTNELSSDNQLWNGLLFLPGSRGNIEHATIESADPAISCKNGSTVSVQHALLSNTSLGVFSESSSCAVTDTRIINRSHDYSRP